MNNYYYNCNYAISMDVTDLIVKVNTITTSDRDNICKFYTGLCSVSDELRNVIPIDTGLYENYELQKQCVYNEIRHGDGIYDDIVMDDCIYSLNQMINYLYL